MTRKPDPRTPEKEMRRAIVDEMMAADKHMTPPRLRRQLAEETGIEVSIRTIRDDLHGTGWHRERRPLCPNMRSEEAKKKRLKFAKKCLAEMRAGKLRAADFIFTDECIFRAGDHIAYQWVKNSQKPDPRVQERYTPKCHVFGLLWRGGHRLIRLPYQGTGPGKGVTAKDFTQTLGKEMTALKRKCKSRTIVMDGASIHTSAHTTKWLEDNGLHVLKGWPAHRPDLNPIENFWANCKREMGDETKDMLKNTEQNRKLLWLHVRNSAMAVSDESTHNYIDGFTARLEEVVRRKGDWIEK